MKSLRLAPIAAALALIACGTVFSEDPLAWLNAVRRTAGAPAVEAEALLSETAARYAARLAARGVITHRGDDGSTGLDRYRALGGTEVRVGEILGAGPSPVLVEAAWMASRDHRALALSPDWSHAGWGSARSGGSFVMVMMFTRKLVEGLRLTVDGSGLRVQGRFVPAQATGGVLLNGLDEVPASEWDPGTRAFQFAVPASVLAGYLRLGCRTAGGGFILTNTFTLPRPPRVRAAGP